MGGKNAWKHPGHFWRSHTHAVKTAVTYMVWFEWTVHLWMSAILKSMQTLNIYNQSGNHFCIVASWKSRMMSVIESTSDLWVILRQLVDLAPLLDFSFWHKWMRAPKVGRKKEPRIFSEWLAELVPWNKWLALFQMTGLLLFFTHLLSAIPQSLCSAAA